MNVTPDTAVFGWLIAVTVVDSWYTFQWRDRRKPLALVMASWMTLILTPLWVVFTASGPRAAWTALALLVFILALHYRFHAVKPPGPPSGYAASLETESGGVR